jgi:GT2 family glycosyltransferase
MEAKVSIVILSYCQAGLVKQLLKLLGTMDLPFVAETIVVDNASPSKSAMDLAGKFPDVKFIAATANRGYAAGNNSGIDAAAGEYVLILNPDVAPTAQSIAALYEFMQQHSRAGIAGPQLVNADGSYQLTCGHFPDWRLPLYRRTGLARTAAGQRWLDGYLMRSWNHADERKVDWLFGAALMVRRSAIREVGLLDELYFLYLEDTDWCRRFWQKNWEVWYVPSSKIIHFHQRESLEGGGLGDLVNPATRIHLASWFKYLWKWRKVKANANQA